MSLGPGGLTPHFSFAELTRSDLATRHGILNVPNSEQRAALLFLATTILEPVRARFGLVRVTSGFRCAELNTLAGGRTNSQHTYGEAADIEVPGRSHIDVVRCIMELPFDQLIAEFWDPDEPLAGWVHVSARQDRPARQEILTLDKTGIKMGLPAWA